MCFRLVNHFLPFCYVNHSCHFILSTRPGFVVGDGVYHTNAYIFITIQKCYLQQWCEKITLMYM